MEELSPSSLHIQLSKEAFVLKTQAQLCKDFAPFQLNFPERFKNHAHSITEIELAIQEQLVRIMREGETRLLQLLYTIDIPEKQFLHLAQSAQFIEQLAQAILIREAMKVYLREKFS